MRRDGSDQPVLMTSLTWIGGFLSEPSSNTLKWITG